VDNAPVHIVDDGTAFNYVKVVFLPPNLTSVLQPLDGGVIRAMKASARKRLLLDLLIKLDESVNHNMQLILP
jgi:hypothetical protein